MNAIATMPDERPPLTATRAATQLDAICDTVARRLAKRRPVRATYRLQFNRTFTFRDARELVPYLAELGISHCYASPYIKACAGSMHGYDVVDHNVLNPEIGDQDDYDAFVHELRRHHMGHILDVVPNHMCVASGDNVWWMNVLENGRGSPYAPYFDIDWMPLKPDLANKVLLPALGDQFGKVLEDSQLVLHFVDGEFFVRYFDRRFPIAPRSWSLVLGHRLERLERELGVDHPELLEYQSILTAVNHLSPHSETDAEKVNQRQREKEVIRRRLTELSTRTRAVDMFLQDNVRSFNGSRGDPHSFDLLDELLLVQPYRLAHWRVAADEINYRRFFDVNDLAAVCMENADVFAATHDLVLKLVAQGKVDGLRIDHPDGLYAPPQYLLCLQQARFLQLCALAAREVVGLPDRDQRQWSSVERSLISRFEKIAQTSPDSPLGRPLHLVVEKILEPGERLPRNWPVHGTTGYDFLNSLNGLFVDRSQVKAIDGLYQRFIRRRLQFQDLVYQCKRLIMQTSMSSEINVLGHQLDRISEQHRSSRDFTLNSLTEALREIIACFPVYRTYVGESGVLEGDRRYIEQAVARAKRNNPATSGSIFDFVRDILLLRYPERWDEAARAAQRRFVGRFQQVTAPIMAKAVEDTASYRFNRLVSLNEVGGNPEVFGTSLAAFHRQNLDRQAHWPGALLATSTHDSKRSEDVRARINVLSEVPQHWRSCLFRWSRWNQGGKSIVDGELVPSRNDECLLYQTLLGTWPTGPGSRTDRQTYLERIQQYMLKATREAKVNTSWISPNEAYELATSHFIAAILTESPRNPFLADLQRFAAAIADLGIWNSLSQTVLKLTCPGVPDIYQGTELWDFSLVDPDNRRPVDFARRREMLAELKRRVDSPECNLRVLAEELVQCRSDGRIKLFLIWRLLNFRRRCAKLFATGNYLRLESTGDKKEHVCAFAQVTARQTALVVAPRLVAGLLGTSSAAPIGREVWGETWLELADEMREATFRNVLTGASVESVTQRSHVALHIWAALDGFPVAVLERTD